MDLKLSQITKSFGEKQVLKGIDLNAESGCALGLLGRNGAGKTTSIRIIMGFFPADSGSVSLDGKPMSRSGISFGYLPEERGLYPKKRIGSQLEYLSMLRGASRGESREKIERWLKRVDLIEYIDKPLNTLSKGNQQKIQLAATLLNDPDIVILDEPFSGLDPVNAQLLKDIVSEQVDLGKIVLFSSHQMGYVEEFCENIAILNSGKIVLSGNLKKIKKGYKRTHIYLESPDSTEVVRVKLKETMPPGSDSILSIKERGDGCVIHMSGEKNKDFVMRSVIDSGISPDVISIVEPTLEDIFVEKTADKI